MYTVRFLLAGAALLLQTSVASSSSSSVAAAPAPGYDQEPTWVPSTLNATQAANLSFGQHYAVLNLDLFNLVLSEVNSTTAGKAFVSNVARWINATHDLNPAPLSIYTRVYSLNGKGPEFGATTPFIAPFRGAYALPTADTPLMEIYPAFFVNTTAGDVVLQKTRSYAGYGNLMEEILKAQNIDTVILSGLKTSGVIASTVYRLYDLDYNIYVIANNTIEIAPDTTGINYNVLAQILPKMGVNVITIEQALAALKRSGPAVY